MSGQRQLWFVPGHGRSLRGDHVHLARDHADLIITVGRDTVEKPQFLMHPGGPRVIHIDFNSVDIDQVDMLQDKMVVLRLVS
jgi:acetolactate synthase-1/2/3 large subunit